jgi:hypothetical protein
MGVTRNVCKTLVVRIGNFGNLDRDCLIMLKWVTKRIVYKHVEAEKLRPSSRAFG